MRRLILYLTLLCAALFMGSCRRAAEKARQNIRLEAVESVVPRGLTGAEVVVRIANNTGYKLLLRTATVSVYYAESCVANIILRDPVEVPRRTTDSFSSLWRIKISDPIAFYVMLKKLQQDDVSQVSVSLWAEGRGGPAPVKFSREMIPMSEILNTFGLSLNDLKNYLP